MSTRFVYSPKFAAFEYGEEHPLRMERLRLTHGLCRDYGLLDLPGTRVLEALPASEQEILRFHTPEYVEVLKLASRGEFRGRYTHGLGPGDNPIFPGLWEWSLLHTGASLQCAREISEGRAHIAFNIAGGLHHALRDRASGFCYVNDPVLAILHLVDRGKRVLYIDIDAHHGDGVQWAFYDDPRVLTLSFHQDGTTLFPGTGAVEEIGRGEGTGYAVNVPMLPGTDDAVFWEGFSTIVPAFLERFRPEVIVSQLGVDSFATDPLAYLEITTLGFCKVISVLTESAIPWVALGGGGYDITNVARAWTLAWAIMNGVDLPEDLPESFIHDRRKLRDDEHRSRRAASCQERMAQNIRYIERHVLPRIGARS
ncbi:MAG: acetoin utilization protein AcuC [Deltaproteobacteria bacterium]|nr:acetoin utilization protein AcuC [Deltaproteobacteria bacterium]